MIFFLAWNTMFIDYWKVLDWNFPEMENAVLFNQKIDEKIIFILYF